MFSAAARTATASAFSSLGTGTVALSGPLMTTSEARTVTFFAALGLSSPLNSVATVRRYFSGTRSSLFVTSMKTATSATRITVAAKAPSQNESSLFIGIANAAASATRPRERWSVFHFSCPRKYFFACLSSVRESTTSHGTKIAKITKGFQGETRKKASASVVKPGINIVSLTTCSL